MLQRQTLPTLSQTTQTAAHDGVIDLRAVDPALVWARLRLRVQGRPLALPLPATFRHFMLFLVVLLAVMVCLMLHVMLSVQIMQGELEASALQAEHARIERLNADLMWQIAHRSDLDDVYARAVASGFVPAEQRFFAAPIVEPDPLAFLADSTDETAPSSVPQNWTEHVSNLPQRTGETANHVLQRLRASVDQ